MANEELGQVLIQSVKKFNQWRANNPGKRVDLHFENLNGANLNGANLNGANLNGANLNGAELSNANLRRASLGMADLSDADLSDADLTQADLKRADLTAVGLTAADLRGANLNEAKLNEAKLSNADLSDADLRKADLREADLREADLRGADLRGADMKGADLIKADLSGAKISLNQLYSARSVMQKQIDSTDIIPEEDEAAEQLSVNTKELAEKSKVYKVVKVQIDHADYLIQMADTIRKRRAVNLTAEQDKALNDLLEIIKGLQEKVKDLEAERDELKSRLPDQWRSKLPDIATAFPKGGLFAAGQETIERITDSEIVQELLSKATECLKEIFSSWLM